MPRPTQGGTPRTPEVVMVWEEEGGAKIPRKAKGGSGVAEVTNPPAKR